MTDGMPCCPKKQAPMPFDCDKCALSGCMLKLSGPGPISTIVNLPVVIATIVPVSDIRRSADFYVGVLGFELRFLAPDGSFARVSRDQATIQFIHTENPDVLAATANNISIYLTVDGVDSLFDALQPALMSLPEGVVRAPFDQSYGMREFHVKDPDGCLLFFGERRPA